MLGLDPNLTLFVIHSSESKRPTLDNQMLNRGFSGDTLGCRWEEGRELQGNI
jgi:hypothetical protein